MSQFPRVPIDERGGKLYPEGTVYYSRNSRGFLAAGREAEGVLPITGVSGRLGYYTAQNGVSRFRDETGVFIPTGVFLPKANTNFGTGSIRIQDVKATAEQLERRPPGDSWFVERQTILMPDGKIKVIEINHGLGNKFDEFKQGKQWWRKMKDALGDQARDMGSMKMHSFVVQNEVIIRTNLGRVSQGG